MRRQPARGFTLVEVIIAVVIITVLAMLTYPTFTQQIRKSRRAEGFQALAALQQAQESWRSTNAAYAPNSQLTSDPGLRLNSSRTPSGYYDIGISTASATGYVASASAVAGSSQAADANCTALWVRMENGNLSYGAGTTVNWGDPNNCWAR